MNDKQISDKQWKHIRRLTIVFFIFFCIGFTIGMCIVKEQEANREKKPPTAYELLERIEHLKEQGD